jgi:hypothetical protein
MSRSIPKLPDPFLKVDSRMKKINKKVEQIHLGISGPAHDPDPHLLKSSNPNSVQYILIADLKHAFLATFETFFQCSLHCGGDAGRPL